MKLKVLKNLIDQAYEASGDGDVNVDTFYEDENGVEHGFDIESVGQFGIIRDVVITLKPYDGGN